MKILVISMGKSYEKYLKSGLETYLKRLKHYTRIEWIELKDVKQSEQIEHTKKEEGILISKQLSSEDFVVLLDENGQAMTSVDFSEFIEKHQNFATKRLVFVIGGAWGFDNSIKTKAHMTLSLSKMTFNHQMIRLFFIEQLYRAYTILKNEKYHNS